jgi:hypothetical protein
MGLETRNYCAGEGQQQFNQQTVSQLRMWTLEASKDRSRSERKQ